MAGLRRAGQWNWTPKGLKTALKKVAIAYKASLPQSPTVTETEEGQ